MLRVYIVAGIIFVLWLVGWVYVLKTIGLKTIIKQLTEPDFFLYF